MHLESQLPGHAVDLQRHHDHVDLGRENTQSRFAAARGDRVDDRVAPFELHAVETMKRDLVVKKRGGVPVLFRDGDERGELFGDGA